MNPNKNIHQHLIRIHQLMNDSLNAYKAYNQNGKTYRFAKELRKCNMEMITLLQADYIHHDDKLNDAANALIEHYTIWRNKWDDMEATILPAPDDVFIFENEHRFPKWASEIFEAKLLKLTENI